MKMNEVPVSIVVQLQVHATTKEEVINKIADNLQEKGYVTNQKKFVQAVFARETELPTFIGHEIGLPHAQSEFVKSAVVVIVRLQEPIIWNEDNKVKLVFLIAVPKIAKNNLHLKILAKLARMLMHEDFREKLATLNEAGVKDLMYKQIVEEKGD